MRRLHGIRTATLAATVLLIFACAGDSAPKNADLDSLPQIALHEDARIGSVDDPDVGFSRPYLLDLDSDGNLYVGEAQDAQIRVYDASGALLRRIGGKGSGPGEFENPPNFGVEGDTVWAYDPSARRITLFKRDGTLLSARASGEITIPLWGGKGSVIPSRMRPDGLFIGELARVSGYRRTEVPVNVADTDTVPVPRVLFDANGAVVDTIGWDPSPPPRMARRPGTSTERYEYITVGSQRIWVPDPPTTLPQWFQPNDGRIVLQVSQPASEDATFTVTRLVDHKLGGDGPLDQRRFRRDTAYALTIHYKAARYTSADLDSVAAEVARTGNGGMRDGVPIPPPSDAAVVQNRVRSALKFPDFKLAVGYGWLDRDDRLWVRRKDDNAGTARWILIDATGNVLGQLELPGNTRLVWSRGDILWTAIPDDNDVPWLVRFRLER
jgi:hypothetical protein